MSDTKKTGSFHGKSNKLGHGGRAAQLESQGVPKAVIGEIARKKGAAPGGPNFHGKKGGKVMAKTTMKQYEKSGADRKADKAGGYKENSKADQKADRSAVAKINGKSKSADVLDQPLFAAVKERLADVPGIDRMSVSNIAGRLEFGMDGKIAAVDENASDAVIDAAIRATFGGHVTPPPVAQPLSAPSAPIIPAKATTMSITGAAPATLSIKAMIEKSRSTVQAAHQKLTDNAAKVQQAADALSSLGDDLGKEGDDLLAMVGQYKNDLAGGS